MPRTLRIRSSGDEVRFLRERLNSRPPAALPLLTPDGKFGAKTRDRVQEFNAPLCAVMDERFNLTIHVGRHWR